METDAYRMGCFLSSQGVFDDSKGANENEAVPKPDVAGFPLASEALGTFPQKRVIVRRLRGERLHSVNNVVTMRHMDSVSGRGAIPHWR